MHSWKMQRRKRAQTADNRLKAREIFEIQYVLKYSTDSVTNPTLDPDF